MNKIFRKGYRRLKKPTHKPLLAIDVENEPSSGDFICAALYGDIKKKSHGNYKISRIEEYFDNQKELEDYLTNLRRPNQIIPCVLIMFNANYDYPFLMKITNDNELLRNGSRIISGELKNGIKILDLTNHTRAGRLEDWIDYLNMNEDFNIFKRDLSDLKRRVENDTKATYYLGKFIQNFYIERLGIPLKLTIASAARTLFQERYFEHYWYRQESEQWKNDYERKAYRGGRVEVFKRGFLKHRSYDVNSQYLSIMRNEKLPDPNSVRYIKEPKSLPIGKLFITDCMVIVPEQYAAPLPILNPEDGKLIFPTGSFRGHFASPELEYAVSECGVRIVKIESVMSYESYGYFRDYAEFIWNERQKYKFEKEVNKGMDLVTKTLGNSLYGSFGQQNKKDSYFGKLSDLNIDEAKGKGLKAKEIGKITVINGEEYVNVTGEEKEDSQHTFPCIPVMITSYARLMLLKALKANEANLVYCDTDSIKLSEPASGMVIGKGLGEWGLEGEFETEFYKPKFYGDKHKGVPKKAVVEKETDEYVKFKYTKPNTMVESVNRGLVINQWIEHTKTLQKQDDKRAWIDNQTSNPLVLSCPII